jgi:leader peptidase (prepilin peptidase) / N-methyltransferase
MFLLLVPVAVFGLVIGSFLTVVVHRVPAGQSLLRPPSHCPNCNTRVRNRYNVPVFGWLASRGRCSNCGVRISIRYPLIELSTCLAFVAVTGALLRNGQQALLPAWLYFTAMAVALTVIDLDCYRLPNAIVLPSYPVLAVLLVVGAAWQRDYSVVIRAIIGCLALFGGYFAISAIYPEGMGFGDVKLAGLIGGMLACLSYSALLIGAFGAFVLGGIAGIAVILSAKGNRKTALPFGPFMLSAAILALFVAQPMVNTYRQLTGV